MARIVHFSNEFYELWDQFIEKHPGSSIYHTSSWLNLLQDTFGYSQKGLLLLDGDRVIGGLPIFEVKGFWGRRLVSSPFRDRGGLLVNQGIDPASLIKTAVNMCLDGKYDFLLIKEDRPLESNILGAQALREDRSWITTTVDLTLGREGIWKRLKNNAIGPVKQAERFGITIRFADSVKDIKIFYSIFLKNRRRLGIPAFSEKFFIEMWNKIFLKEKAKLLIAQKNDVSIGGMIVFLHKNIVIDAYAASNSEYRALRSNDLLVWKALEWSINNGYTVFDFGADSHYQKNLLAFKRKWIGIHKPMCYYFLLNKTQNINMMDSSDKRYLLIRKIVSRLPLPIFRILSDLSVSHFG